MWKFLMVENMTSPHWRAGEALGPPWVEPVTRPHPRGGSRSPPSPTPGRPGPDSATSADATLLRPQPARVVSVQPCRVQAALRRSWALPLCSREPAGLGRFVPALGSAPFPIFLGC